jgi:hypothetical protein
MKIATVIIADRTMMVLASAEASTLDEDLVQQAAQQLAGQRVAVGAEFVQLRVASRMVLPSNRSRASSRRPDMSACAVGASTVAPTGAAARSRRCCVPWEFGFLCHSLHRRVSYVVAVKGGGQLSGWRPAQLHPPFTGQGLCHGLVSEVTATAADTATSGASSMGPAGDGISRHRADHHPAAWPIRTDRDRDHGHVGLQ